MKKLLLLKKIEKVIKKIKFHFFLIFEKIDCDSSYFWLQMLIFTLVFLLLDLFILIKIWNYNEFAFNILSVWISLLEII